MSGVFTCVLLFVCITCVTPYIINLSNNGPVVLGATITFNSELLNDDGSSPSGTFRFFWQDNAIPQNSGQTEGEATTSLWNVTYSPSLYGPGLYEVQVSVSRIIFINWNIGSARQYFNISGLLNGEIHLEQNTSMHNRNYISSAKEVNHEIVLRPADSEFITKYATSVKSYWFINNVYYGEKTNLSFKFNYTDAVDQDRTIESLVIVSFDPPVPNTTLAPPTTTIMPTSIPTTVTPPTTMTPSTTTTLKTREVRSVSSTVAPTAVTTMGITTNDVMPTVEQLIMEGKNMSQILLSPYVCLNKTCGSFKKKIKVRAPVNNVVVAGTNWLQHGDMLNLSVTCNGSAPYAYCIKIVLGEYNATGNETCLNERIISDCQLAVLHYFRLSDTYTVLIIIGNEVSKKVSPVVVNVYQVTKHPQLSVIVVPVACISIAFVLIVFGVAYYIQSQRRYVIEVADFDFVQASGMEYKTFMERLRDSVSATINRTQDYVEEGNVWSPSRKYGSMQ